MPMGPVMSIVRQKVAMCQGLWQSLCPEQARHLANGLTYLAPEDTGLSSNQFRDRLWGWGQSHPPLPGHLPPRGWGQNLESHPQCVIAIQNIVRGSEVTILATNQSRSITSQGPGSKG